MENSCAMPTEQLLPEVLVAAVAATTALYTWLFLAPLLGWVASLSWPLAVGLVLYVFLNPSVLARFWRDSLRARFVSAKNWLHHVSGRDCPLLAPGLRTHFHVNCQHRQCQTSPR
ncbi:uncharacterized protein LOC134540209 [Bacillus rossius redtenbacheri]|uniref:uncharacterized protein LOC134540209 n=1 Tax=Bacillus rossius redtenbacheri TaxID=93214 RepID=UPI002FDE89B2